MSNDRRRTLFIILSCTCSVALHYINYSHWKSDHQSRQNPSWPGSHGDEDTAVVRLVKNHQRLPGGQYRRAGPGSATTPEVVGSKIPRRHHFCRGP
ncbi:hypothetical protein DPEC_G00285020 [Dallia pectoralis]|uniref:Uncharacterized protein n=1 Tax=Dallia pectoralis TaxID=75939 RepID=A0ACC2FJS1_DALPE|nr:hypothetical protein DPEC_G00285020 [Dallia pectoralis]